MLALPDAARCRSMRPAPRADDMRPRPRRAAGLPEVQEGWQAPGCNAAPACPALAPAAAGELNAKLKSDFRCYTPTTDMRRLHRQVRFVPTPEVTPVLARGSRHISYCRPDRENMPRSSWGDIAAGAQASLHIGRPFRVPRHNNDQLPHESRRGRPSCLRCSHLPADDRTEAQ